MLGKCEAGTCPILDVECGKIQDAAEQYKIELKECDAKLSEIAALIEANGQRVAEYEREISEYERELEELRERLRESEIAKAQAEEMSEQFNKLKARAVKYENKIARYEKYRWQDKIYNSDSSKRAKIEMIESRIEELRARIEDDESKLKFRETLIGEFDSALMRKTSKEYMELSNTYAALKARHDERQQHRNKLKRRVMEMDEKASELDAERTNSKALSNMYERVRWLRALLRELPRHILETRLLHINHESDQFWKLFKNTNDVLVWGTDYSISIFDVNMNKRTFKQLSGGEKTTAALAVQCGIIRNLSPLRLAIFDEPTYGCDPIVREQIAATIGRITGFEQVIVISHYEGFDSYVNHTINL